MKAGKCILGSSLICLFWINPCFAQTVKDASPVSAQIFLDTWGKPKNEIIKDYLEFSETESRKFWPHFDLYQKKKDKIFDEKISLVKDYASNYRQLNNVQAQKLTNLIFRNESKMAREQKKLFKKLQKDLSPLRASQFIQLEKYLDANLETEIRNGIPFFRNCIK